MASPRWRTDWCSLLVIIVWLAACAGRPWSESEGETETRTEAHASTLERLDAALARSWTEAGIEPSAPASDAEFLRRASLDLIGRVPTQAEVERFLADEAPDKRAKLVDALLTDAAWAEHWAGLWTARLLPADRRARRYAEQPLEDYLSTVLAAGRSWDGVVTELLTAEGELAKHPEAAFVGARALRGERRNDALAELSSTSARVFLGETIECAQCHDHPYDPTFTREDFWAQAALFGRAFVAIERDGKQRSIELRERWRGEVNVALDEAGEQFEVIEPRYMGAADSPDTTLRRVALAKSITADERFASATAAWTWTQLLGGEAQPDTLAPLVEAFRRDHDLRGLVRTIALSQAYQRSSAGPGAASQIAAAEAVFARARVRPLSAEQLFASLLTVTELEQVDDRGFRRAVRQRKQLALKEYEFVFDDDEMAGGEALSASVSQALLLLNGGVTNHGVIARPGSSLDRILSASDETDARLESLWLTIYGRPPRPDELALGREAVDGRRPAAWEDLMFAMLFSSEFSTNH